MFSESDHHFMARALELARRGLNTTNPNPRVGCVIVRDGVTLGEGWHQKLGGPHAEVEAIADAKAKGHELRGATAYVTLEPCSHFGRTPPCADALVREKIAKVVAAMEDPNPLVNGQGFEKLRAVGMEVRCGLFEREARELNPGFVSRVTRGRPWVRLKTGMTLDAKVALQNGQSQWITSQAAREDGHLWRARACIMLTGIGTVRDDDPLLNVRLTPEQLAATIVSNPLRQPLRVVLDSAFEINPLSRIFQSGPVLIVCATEPDPSKVAMLKDKGGEVIVIAGAEKNGRPKTDLQLVMTMLAERGFSEVHVEAGSKLNGSLLAAGLVDELLMYVAPSLIGAGQSFADLPQVQTLSDRHEFDFVSVDRIGPDVRLIARRSDSFLKA